MPDSSRPLLERGTIATTQGDMTPLAASYTASLNIWIKRFRTAQGEIRTLEKQVEESQGREDRLRERLSLALELMTDEQLAELARATTPAAAPRASLPVIQPDSSCGCGSSH